MYSEKDRSENMITGDFIKDVFNQLKDLGLLENDDKNDRLHNSTLTDEIFFIRRLRHLQHICQSFEGKMKNEDFSIGKFFLQLLCMLSCQWKQLKCSLCL